MKNKYIITIVVIVITLLCFGCSDIRVRWSSVNIIDDDAKYGQEQLDTMQQIEHLYDL